MSTWTLVIITIERIISVLFPLKVKGICTVKLVVTLEIIVCLILSGFNAIRIFTFIYLKYSFMIFEKFQNGVHYYHWTEFVFNFVIPFWVLSVGSIIILIRLRQSAPGNDTTRRQTRLVSITRNLVGANITFIITNIPFRAINLLRNAGSLEHMGGLERMTVVMLCIYVQFLNQALNFYVYVLSGQTFRESAKKILVSVFKRLKP
ncbi:hypothetical protein MAR_014276 [Mya arenaria]|uniref:G-protein coupled receptors family 1 profile domain-containing protein n=1 Tax=Mya arenaria TaxID=6604 RepID=A0ABY7G5I1_MYAAR|nr:hypothetical protein MAR_014276 [Mya arenaria]